MNRTKIEYLTHTWNPIAMRCTPVSSGCKNCWHTRVVDQRFINNPNFSEDVIDAYRGGKPVLLQKRIKQLVNHKRGGNVVGVQFMGDLFHENISNSDIVTVLLAMMNSENNIFMLLTKRPKRMKDILREYKFSKRECPNIWLGVSVESYKEAWRLDELYSIDWRNTWVSFEPLLGSVKPNEILLPAFVTVGGETGVGSRECRASDIEEISDTCLQNNIPYFFKHTGSNFVGNLSATARRKITPTKEYQRNLTKRK